MLTGGPPFEGETPLAVPMKHKTERPRDPKETNPQVPDALSRFILRCLEKDREKRFQSAEEILADLRSIKRHLPLTGVTGGATTKTLPFRLKPRLRLGLIAAAGIRLAGAGFFTFRRGGGGCG